MTGIVTLYPDFIDDITLPLEWENVIISLLPDFLVDIITPPRDSGEDGIVLPADYLEDVITLWQRVAVVI